MASSTITITRTADTNVYAANDVVGEATGATAAKLIANVGRGNKTVRIIGSELRIDAAAVIAGETSYRLHLYSGTPPSVLGDNAAFDVPAGDRASYLGFLELGTPVDLGSTLYVQAEQGKDLKTVGSSLYGYLVTVGTYTPTSARVYNVTIHTMAVD